MILNKIDVVTQLLCYAFNWMNHWDLLNIIIYLSINYMTSYYYYSHLSS